MRYSTVPAIDFDVMVARNRELIKALPQEEDMALHWSPAKQEFYLDSRMAVDQRKLNQLRNS